jgi:hypothetical protein
MRANYIFVVIFVLVPFFVLLRFSDFHNCIQNFSSFSFCIQVCQLHSQLL